MGLNPRFAAAGSTADTPLRIPVRHHQGDRVTRGKRLFERIVEQMIKVMLGLIVMSPVCRRTDPFHAQQTRARRCALNGLISHPCPFQLTRPFVDDLNRRLRRPRFLC